jgi:hypothetical protein
MSIKPGPDKEYQQWMRRRMKKLLVLSMIIIPVGLVLKLISIVLLGILGALIAGFKLSQYKQ